MQTAESTLAGPLRPLLRTPSKRAGSEDYELIWASEQRRLMLLTITDSDPSV